MRHITRCQVHECSEKYICGAHKTHFFYKGLVFATELMFNKKYKVRNKNKFENAKCLLAGKKIHIK
jgi:hypothetical protein